MWSCWPYLTARQVANTLFTTATDLGVAGVDAVYGRGLVNLQRAMQPIGTTSMSTTTATRISSLGTWFAGPAYAANLFDYARSGGFSMAVVDELGRDFQADLGGLVAAPRRAE